MERDIFWFCGFLLSECDYAAHIVGWRRGTTILIILDRMDKKQRGINIDHKKISTPAAATKKTTRQYQAKMLEPKRGNPRKVPDSRNDYRTNMEKERRMTPPCALPH